MARKQAAPKKATSQTKQSIESVEFPKRSTKSAGDHSTTQTSEEPGLSHLAVIGPDEKWDKDVVKKYNETNRESKTQVDNQETMLSWKDFLYHTSPMKSFLAKLESGEYSNGTILFGWRPPNRILWERQLHTLNLALSKSTKEWKKYGIHVSPKGLSGIALQDERPYALQVGFSDLYQGIDAVAAIGEWGIAKKVELQKADPISLPDDLKSRVRRLLLSLQDIDSTRRRESGKTSVLPQNQFIEELIREIQADAEADATPMTMTLMEHWSAAILSAAVLAYEFGHIDAEKMEKMIHSELGNLKKQSADVRTTPNDYLAIATICLAIDPRHLKSAEKTVVSVSKQFHIANPDSSIDTLQERPTRLEEAHLEFLEFVKSTGSVNIGNFQVSIDQELTGIMIKDLRYSDTDAQ